MLNINILQFSSKFIQQENSKFWLMTTTNKQTAAIWTEKLGDAYVGCYGLMDDFRRANDCMEEEQE